ncbi:hypothetical protein A0H81_05469 [Grifola frondosa]|uniref:Chitinase n=1 Tax=Grifola frondosa TaxID=5627 RepID=A0A1C7MCF6_GRIFR|nr:hypothetical protein A0H81_05469 [Grifola frondosa]
MPTSHPSATKTSISQYKYGRTTTMETIPGFNVFALAFLLSSGPRDQAAAWTELSADQRTTLKSQYSSAGISVIVSAFGSTEHPTTEGLDPAATASTMAQFVLNNNLDGIDVDYEDEPA